MCSVLYPPDYDGVSSRPEDYVDASFEEELNLWLKKANLSETPSYFIQKHWTSPLSDATFDQLTTDLDV